MLLSRRQKLFWTYIDVLKSLRWFKMWFLYFWAFWMHWRENLDQNCFGLILMYWSVIRWFKMRLLYFWALWMHWRVLFDLIFWISHILLSLRISRNFLFYWVWDPSKHPLQLSLGIYQILTISKEMNIWLFRHLRIMYD